MTVSDVRYTLLASARDAFDVGLKTIAAEDDWLDSFLNDVRSIVDKSHQKPQNIVSAKLLQSPAKRRNPTGSTLKNLTASAQKVKDPLATLLFQPYEKENLHPDFELKKGWPASPIREVNSPKLARVVGPAPVEVIKLAAESQEALLFHSDDKSNSTVDIAPKSEWFAFPPEEVSLPQVVEVEEPAMEGVETSRDEMVPIDNNDSASSPHPTSWLAKTPSRSMVSQPNTSGKINVETTPGTGLARSFAAPQTTGKALTFVGLPKKNYPMGLRQSTSTIPPSQSQSQIPAKRKSSGGSEPPAKRIENGSQDRVVPIDEETASKTRRELLNSRLANLRKSGIARTSVAGSRSVSHPHKPITPFVPTSVAVNPVNPSVTVSTNKPQQGWAPLNVSSMRSPTPTNRSVSAMELGSPPPKRPAAPSNMASEAHMPTVNERVREIETKTAIYGSGVITSPRQHTVFGSGIPTSPRPKTPLSNMFMRSPPPAAMGSPTRRIEVGLASVTRPTKNAIGTPPLKSSSIITKKEINHTFPSQDPKPTHEDQESPPRPAAQVMASTTPAAPLPEMISMTPSGTPSGTPPGLPFTEVDGEDTGAGRGAILENVSEGEESEDENETMFGNTEAAMFGSDEEVSSMLIQPKPAENAVLRTSVMSNTSRMNVKKASLASSVGGGLNRSILGSVRRPDGTLKSIHMAQAAAKKEQMEKGRKAAIQKEREERRNAVMQKKKEQEEEKARQERARLEEERRLKAEALEKKKRERDALLASAKSKPVVVVPTKAKLSVDSKKGNGQKPLGQSQKGGIPNKTGPTPNKPNPATASATKGKPKATAYEELPEIDTDGSDSDDDTFQAKLPGWARSPLNSLMNQQHQNPDELFGPIPPLSMKDLFSTDSSRARLNKRSSSAHWEGTDALTEQEQVRYAKVMGFK